ncbi:MAG: alpha/beta hydrolase fold domain-containing protein, partial [Methanobrevibacter sp.]|nr:alpha/beta hydrolase fold domain-containing protein [Methanobrevibacter sp.]
TQPDNSVVFSPGVDSSVSDEYDSSNDPSLGEVGLRDFGKSGAGDLDTKDYRVSPLYGDKEGLAKTLIFAGDNEIFYKDIEEYVKNAPDVRLIVGKGMFHIYPLFPMPETFTSFKEIKKEIM